MYANRAKRARANNTTKEDGKHSVAIMIIWNGRRMQVNECWIGQNINDLHGLLDESTNRSGSKEIESK